MRTLSMQITVFRETYCMQKGSVSISDGLNMTSQPRFYVWLFNHNFIQVD